VIEALSADFADAEVITSAGNGRVQSYLSAHADIYRQQFVDDRVIISLSPAASAATTISKAPVCRSASLMARPSPAPPTKNRRVGRATRHPANDNEERKMAQILTAIPLEEAAQRRLEALPGVSVRSLSPRKTREWDLPPDLLRGIEILLCKFPPRNFFDIWAI